MKITFFQYLLVGVLGVVLCATTIGRFLQTDLAPYKGKDKTILFLTRNLSQEGRQFGPRMFTLWNLSHVLYYALGAYLFPDKALLLWVIGIVWEIIEIPFCASNILDVVWNAIGIFIGLQLRKLTL